eukprot:GILJ01010561.1.p1 GENE.GILJ01010561.1~~GILJ01010561.1.p1  ORF type:complete len:842 (-),score=140.48 GILJ01010561.1:205-2730(-)
MRIYVVFLEPELGNNKTVALDVQLEDSINDLNNLLEQRTGVPPAEQYLTAIVNGTKVLLYGAWTFKFYDIRPYSRIDLLRIKKAGLIPSLSQQVNNKNLLTLQRGTTDTLDEVEDAISIEVVRIDRTAPKSRYFARLGLRASIMVPSSVTNGTNGPPVDVPAAAGTISPMAALFRAAKYGSKGEVAAILDSGLGLTVETKNEKDWSCIHFAAMGGHLKLLKFLLSKGVDVNLVTTEGWTPLQLASYHGLLDAVKELLEQPVDVNARTKIHGTALHCASKQGHVQVVQLLIQKGADPSILDFDEKSALQVAPTDSKVRNVLRQDPRTPKDLSEPAVRKPDRKTGFLRKLGGFITNIKRRWFVLDPDAKTLSYYKKEHHYPSDPRGTISLKDVKKVCASEGYPKLTKPETDFCLEVGIGKRTYLLIAEDQNTATEWIQAIQDVLEWITYTESLSSNPEDRSPSKQRSPNKAVTSPNGLHNGHDSMGPSSPSNSTLESALSDDSISLSHFECLQVLGAGSFGKVLLVRKKNTNKIYAMKVLKKKTVIEKKQVKYATTERNVLEAVNHPFIISLQYAFQTTDKLFLVLDYCSGGDLAFHLAKKRRFGEDQARFYAAEIVLAVEHLHQLDVVYRDLKPENVLLDHEGHVRLADFGLSKEGIRDSRGAQSFCGSPAYLAPEMLARQGYGKAVDWYGLGALLYEMVTGVPPFFSRDIQEMFSKIQHGELKYPSYISIEVRLLLAGLLQKNPLKRLGSLDVSQIKNHCFFESMDWELLAQRKVKPPFVPKQHGKEAINFDVEFREMPVESPDQHGDSALLKLERFDGFSFVASNDDPSTTEESTDFKGF